MTNLEAIKGKLNYPLSDNSFILALSGRDLVYTETYTASDKRSLELAQADLIYTLASAPNITEGGYSVSLSDKKTMLKVADGIYRKYGIYDVMKPTAKFVQKW
jgi:hypothetical protein